MSYNVRRIRHVCSVRGCGNRETILIAKNGQLGGVYLCAECAKKAFEVFSEAEKKADAAKTEKEAVADEVVSEPVKKAAKKKAASKDGE